MFRAVFYLLREFIRPGIVVAHFGRTKATGGEQHWTQMNPESQFLLDAARYIRYGVEQF
jgi:hypothetical protein